MRLLSSAILLGSGCLMVAMAMARDRWIWLLLALPLIATGLAQGGMRLSLAAFLEWLARVSLERAKDCRVIGAMALEAPADCVAEFRRRRKETTKS